jgi:YegS/Rv2252/BmrU family lipid kinase
MPSCSSSGAAPRRVRLLLNPSAGRRPRAERLAPALAWLEARGWLVEQRTTEGSGHAQELAAEAAGGGYETVLVCGGDGTINEAVNGLAGSDTALAVMPAGTVNVWAREAGIPRQPEAAVRLLEEGERHRVDLGRANDRFFLLLASVGTDSYAVRAVSAAAKRRWGRYAFIAAGLRDLALHGGRQIRVEGEGGSYSGSTLVAVVGNTRLYGGLLRATYRACIDDGLLDLCLYPGGRLQLAGHLLRTLAGRHEPRALYRQGRRFVISGAEPMPYELDGEYAGETPLTIESIPSALTVVTPQGSLAALTGGADGRSG